LPRAKAATCANRFGMLALRSMIVLRRLSKSRGTRALWGSLSMLTAQKMKQIFHISEHKRFPRSRLIVFNRLKMKGFRQFSTRRGEMMHQDALVKMVQIFQKFSGFEEETLK
jgi:hypothetical protein